MRKAEVLLHEVRALIERGWTQGAIARDAQGKSTFCTLDGAVSWCLVGALRAHERDYHLLTRNRVVKLLQEATSAEELARWNDAQGRTQEEVLSAVDEAIELARS